MELQETLALELGRVSRGWRTRLNERLRETGLTQARWNTLLQLSRGAEGMTQRELAQCIGVEAPTIARLLDALEKQGLIHRRAVNGDRRAYHIHLTAAARPILKEIDRIAVNLRRELLAGIPAQDLTSCLAVLQQIGDRLEK